jgi:hypothetical protein
MIRKKDPGREEKPLSTAYRTEAACQTSKVRLDQISSPGPQFHREEEEAVGEKRTPKPGHEGSVTGQRRVLQAHRPQTPDCIGEGHGVCATP